jgi:hypothetical protein
LSYYSSYSVGVEKFRESFLKKKFREISRCERRPVRRDCGYFELLQKLAESAGCAHRMGRRGSAGRDIAQKSSGKSGTGKEIQGQETGASSGPEVGVEE